MAIPEKVRRYLSEAPDRTLLCTVPLSNPFDQSFVYRTCFLLGRVCERVDVRMKWRTVKLREMIYLIVVFNSPEDAFAVRIGTALKLIPANDVLASITSE